MPVTLHSSERMSSPSPKSWISREHPCAAPPSVLEDAPVPFYLSASAERKPLPGAGSLTHLPRAQRDQLQLQETHSCVLHCPTDRARAEENGLDVDNILLKAPSPFPISTFPGK